MAQAPPVIETYRKIDISHFVTQSEHIRAANETKTQKHERNVNEGHACSSSTTPNYPLSLGRGSRPTFCFVDKGPPYVKFWRSQNFRVFSSGRAKISKKSAIFLIRPHQISCFSGGGGRPLRDSDILEHA